MIYGFYHVSVMKDHWKTIFLDQINKIQSSGLYEKTEKIYLGILSKNYDFTEFNLPSKYEILFNYNDISLGEIPTLQKLWNFCQTEDVNKIWYIHAKGVSREPNAGIEDWRKYMEEFVINGHEACCESLEEFDACGVDWYSPEEIVRIWGRECGPHFSGNFWWANSQYIKFLPPLNTSSRMDAETFIGKGNPKVKCFNKSYKVMYLERYLPQNYKRCKAYKPRLNI